MTRFAERIRRNYQTKDGSFGTSPNLGLADLGDAVYGLVAAGLWIEAQRQPRTRNGGYSVEGTEPEVDFETDGAEFEQF